MQRCRALEEISSSVAIPAARNSVVARSTASTRKPTVRPPPAASSCDVTANDDPSGRANTSASMPSMRAGTKPSTSRTNTTMAVRAAVLVPTNVMPCKCIRRPPHSDRVREAYLLPRPTSRKDQLDEQRASRYARLPQSLGRRALTQVCPGPDSSQNERPDGLVRERSLDPLQGF